ncbi:BTAD domain-containing putative transcriptional regulator [Streptomyces sp. E11-3]|uniref:AfsR/SARP family transcriptional regulator n=1 Tax=Streptomyces sp. E11-3 TaxID=3110112 RepID=UPI00397FAF82
MDFRILGPVEARDGTRRIPTSGTKAHTVLAALLLARGRLVGDERLSMLLWGWEPPATMHAQIYTYISRLRKLLGPSVQLIRRQPGYQMVAEGARVDFVEYERLDRVGRQELAARRPQEASRLLGAALDLWQGPALANVTPQLAEAELPRLEEARATTLEHRIEADLALGRHQQLVQELTGLVTEHPIRERLRAQLMTALYRSGRQSDALRVFHEGREMLATELGVDPGPDLTRTYQQALTGELTLAPQPVRLSVPAQPGAPAAEQLPSVPLLLPPAPEGFVGREEQLAELHSLLTSPEGDQRVFRPTRLLITGMPGVGKTALALRTAHAHADGFPGGQLYADLCRPDGSAKDPSSVLVELLQALGEPTTPRDLPDAGPDALGELIRRYRTRTANRRLLILLDNAVGELQLDALLPGSSRSTVLVTSRSRLTTVHGSYTIELDPLGRRPALDLLASTVGSARLAAEPEAALDIVTHCGGLPLAIRAAGARLAARPRRPLTHLAVRLANPGYGIRELVYGGLDVGEAVLVSLRRLRADERELLRRLSALGGRDFLPATAGRALGLPPAAAEEFLERLVDASLLDMPGIDDAGRPQYRLHSLVRQVAAAQPAPTPAGGPTRTG